MNETTNDKLIRLMREAVRLVQIADRGVIGEALGDAHRQFLYEATACRMELEAGVTDEGRINWMEKNISAMRDIGWMPGVFDGSLRDAIDAAMRTTDSNARTEPAIQEAK